MKVITLIPARLGSTRLPNKPLADINGLPMIVQVINRAKEAGLSDIYVAAAEKEIADAVEKNGHRAILTDPALPSGTDRIYAALQKVVGKMAFDIVLNLQGDLPTIEPDIIANTITLLRNGRYDITTAAAQIKNDEEKANPNVVKAVVAWKGNYGRALYFTRATAPHGNGPLYHHIGLYAYKREALEKFVKLPVSSLEAQEKLEQLRALENNMKIGVVQSRKVPLGVDTKEDLEKARIILSR